MTTTTMSNADGSEQTKIEQRRLANRNTVRKFRFREKVMLEQLRRSVNVFTKKNATLRQDNKVCKSAISHIKSMLSTSMNNTGGAITSVPSFTTPSSIIEDPINAFQPQQRCQPLLCSTSAASLSKQEHQQEQLMALLLQRQQQPTMMAKPSGLCVADLLKLRQQKPHVNLSQTDDVSALMNVMIQQRRQRMLQSYMQQSLAVKLPEQHQQVQPNLSGIRAMLNMI